MTAAQFQVSGDDGADGIVPGRNTFVPFRSVRFGEVVHRGGTLQSLVVQLVQVLRSISALGRRPPPSSTPLAWRALLLLVHAAAGRSRRSLGFATAGRFSDWLFSNILQVKVVEFQSLVLSGA